MFRHLISILLVLLLFALINPSVNATTMIFNDFSNPSLLTLSGNASTTMTGDGVVLRLTPANVSQHGSAFSTATINAATFSTYFKFRITDWGGTLFDGNPINGADGLVFVAQSVSASIGGAGHGIGYEGISPSIGVEFDTWLNPYHADPSSNHIGIDVNGSVDHLPGDTVNVGNHSVREEGFDNGEIWYSWIDYNGTTLDVRINDDAIRPTNAILSKDLDIASILGVSDAYVGFTSGTGADWGNHDILYWEYRDEFDPINPIVPEPSTCLLLLFGILGLIGVKKKFS